MKHPNSETQTLIEEVNSECPYGQGIFFQPYGIPVNVKEHVLVSSYTTSGIRGGSCWGTKHEHYQNEKPNDHMIVLEKYLTKVFPDCKYLQFKEIERLIESDERFEQEYYGNNSNVCYEWIVLSELEKIIERFKDENRS